MRETSTYLKTPFSGLNHLWLLLWRNIKKDLIGPFWDAFIVTTNKATNQTHQKLIGFRLCGVEMSTEIDLNVVINVHIMYSKIA